MHANIQKIKFKTGAYDAFFLQEYSFFYMKSTNKVILSINLIILRYGNITSLTGVSILMFFTDTGTPAATPGKRCFCMKTARGQACFCDVYAKDRLWRCKRPPFRR